MFGGGEKEGCAVGNMREESSWFPKKAGGQ